MKNLGLVLILFVLLIGCSNNEVDSFLGNANANNSQDLTIMKKEIESVKSENEFLNEKIKNFSTDIQILDHQSRKIMDLIKEGKLDELKSELTVDFELTDDNMFMFENYDDASYFYTDLASLPMYFSYYNPTTEGNQIGYHVYGGAEGQEFKKTVTFFYNADSKLEFIFAGE